MSRFIIIQETGSDQVLVIDKDSKTVETIDASLLDEFEDEAGATLRAAQAEGRPVMQGISAAIAGKQRLELSGRYYYAAA